MEGALCHRWWTEEEDDGTVRVWIATDLMVDKWEVRLGLIWGTTRRRYEKVRSREKEERRLTCCLVSKWWNVAIVNPLKKLRERRVFPSFSLPFLIECVLFIIEKEDCGYLFLDVKRDRILCIILSWEDKNGENWNEGRCIAVNLFFLNPIRGCVHV